MNRYVLMSAAFMAMSVVGCASVEQQSAELRAEKTYNTGSRIPVRDGSGSGSVKSIEMTKETAEDIGARSGIAPGTVGR